MQGGSTNNFGRKLYWMKLRTFDSKMNNEEVQERGQVQTRELLTVYDDGSVKVCLPAPSPISSWGPNRPNQLCSDCAAIIQSCWSLSPEYCEGGLGRRQPLPHYEFWIQNNGNELCSNCAQCAAIFFQLYRPLFPIIGGWFSELSPLHCEFWIRYNGH